MSLLVQNMRVDAPHPKKPAQDKTPTRRTPAAPRALGAPHKSGGNGAEWGAAILAACLPGRLPAGRMRQEIRRRAPDRDGPVTLLALGASSLSRPQTPFDRRLPKECSDIGPMALLQ
jgi:hypothetical protein